MNRIFREASKKFNITQAQAENIYLSMFKFIRDELDHIDFHQPLEQQRTSFVLPFLGKVRVNSEKLEVYDRKYKERNNGEDCAYV